MPLPEGACAVEIRNQRGFVLERRSQGRLRSADPFQHFFLVAKPGEPGGACLWKVDEGGESLVESSTTDDGLRFNIRLNKDTIEELVGDLGGAGDSSQLEARVTVEFLSEGGERTCEESVVLVWGVPQDMN